VTEPRDWRAIFDEVFQGATSPLHHRVWRAALGDEYPEELDPYSYISRTELDRIRRELRVAAGDTMADLGCGRGGPGLWLAAATGADLVGVDISPAAVEAATAHASALGLADRARYQVGTFAQTGLGTASVDAVVSVDALLFAPDKEAACVELARVLRPGGRLAATTWDYHSQPVGRPPQVDDHRPLLHRAGFAVEAYEETVDWRDRQQAITDGLLASVDELAAESGEDPATVRASIEEMGRTQDTMIRRVLIVATNGQ
jgi:SAM-dependent methyltransferase